RFDTFGKQLSYALQAHRSFSVESIFNPDGRVVVGAHRNYIKAAWLVGALREARQVMPGRQHQASLLALVNGCQRAAEIVLGAVAHLDKHQRVAMLHDQVDFAKPAAPVLRYQFEALFAQPLAGKLLAGVTALLARPLRCQRSLLRSVC